MEAENLLNLLDSYWFEQEILKKQQLRPSNSEANPNPVQPSQELPDSGLPPISTRSMDELLSFSSESSNNSVSPSSVLLPRRLQPIFSGKEAKHASEEEEEEEEASRRLEEGADEIEIPKSLSTSRGERRRNRKKKLQRGFSKSLSDLEFEELRGFMDLGFVFLEEDKGSEFLTTILPGLQRLGSEEEEEADKQQRDSGNGSQVSRPYLSEAWKVSERMRSRENQALMVSWENLPSVGNKIDMKDYLKSWAHNVASSVR